MTIKVYADELLRLTVDDLGDEILVEIKDPENETDEHLAHLNSLHPRESTPSAHSTSSLCCTPVIDQEEEKRETWLREQESYQALVADGGQPSHSISHGFDVIEKPGDYKEYQDIIWFWRSSGAISYSVFHSQLDEWKRFREFQDQMRNYYIPRNRWDDYENRIQESQADLGCTRSLRVLEDRHRQNRVEDWIEFRAFYYRKLNHYQRFATSKQQELLVAEKNLAEAQERLPDAIGDEQILFDRRKEIEASTQEIAEAKMRVESAEKRLEAAERDKSKRKDALIMMAQQELSSAKDNLNQVSGSEEKRRLRDGEELRQARVKAMLPKIHLDEVALDIKAWSTFLKWIDDQYPAIAAECGLFADGTTHDDPVPSPGEKEPLQSQKVRPQQRQRRCSSNRSGLGPNPSSAVSKPSQGQRVSSRLRATRVTKPQSANLLQDVEARVSVITATQKRNDLIANTKPRTPPKLSKPTLQPVRRSPRIAERVKALQVSGGLSETRTKTRQSQQLAGSDLPKKKVGKGATTKRGQKPQGITKRKSRAL